MSFTFQGSGWAWNHPIEACSPTVADIWHGGQWYELDTGRPIPPKVKTIPERVRQLQAVHVKLIEENDKRWHNQAMLQGIDPASHYHCVAFNVEEARDWTELKLIEFQDRCKWERRMRMAIASGTIMSSFRTQFPQLLADQHLAHKEAKPPRPRTLDAYVARMKLAQSQARVSTNTATAHEAHATQPRPAIAEMGQARTRLMWQQPTKADSNNATVQTPATTKTPTTAKTPRAGPKAIAIVAPTPEWEAAR